MLRGGITCFNDMYFFPDAALEAARGAGMRVALGIIVFEFPSAYASDAADYLRKGLALRDREGEDPLVSFCLAPHAPYTVSDASFRQVAKLAAELDLPVHVHLHETEDENRRSLAEHGDAAGRAAAAPRPARAGPHRRARGAPRAAGDRASRQPRLRRSRIVRRRTSSSRAASRRSRRCAKRASNLCLGTDGAASNNRLDLFQEMRTAALLAKAVAGDAQALPAHAALRAATLGGAQALGLEALAGSIAPGKAADLVAVALRGPELAPCYDPVSHLVYAAGREHVTHVWVNGEAARDRRLACSQPPLPVWKSVGSYGRMPSRVT